MIKNYLQYELKKSVWPIIILTIVGALIYLPILITSDFYEYNSYIPETRLGAIATFLCIICTVIPIYEFSFQKKKRSVDEFFSLPIKRAALIAVKFVSGYLKIIISYSIVFFLGLLIVLSKNINYYYGYYFLFYLSSILLAIVLYAFNAFIFSRGNSILDGILFIILYIFMVLLIIISINQLVYDLFNKFNFLESNYLTPYSPISNLTNYFDTLIRYGRLTHFMRGSLLEGFLIWSIIGVASLFGLFYSVKTDKAERAEQISNSYFGYRTVIPLYVILIFYATQLNISSTINLLFYAMIFGSGLVGFIIYRRTFKLPLKYWIILSSAFIVGIILTSLSQIGH